MPSPRLKGYRAARERRRRERRAERAHRSTRSTGPARAATSPSAYAAASAGRPPRAKPRAQRRLGLVAPAAADGPHQRSTIAARAAPSAAGGREARDAARAASARTWASSRPLHDSPRPYAAQATVSGSSSSRARRSGAVVGVEDAREGPGRRAAHHGVVMALDFARHVARAALVLGARDGRQELTGSRSGRRRRSPAGVRGVRGAWVGRPRARAPRAANTARLLGNLTTLTPIVSTRSTPHRQARDGQRRRRPAAAATASTATPARENSATARAMCHGHVTSMARAIPAPAEQLRREARVLAGRERAALPHDGPLGHARAGASSRAMASASTLVAPAPPAADDDHRARVAAAEQVGARPHLDPPRRERRRRAARPDRAARGTRARRCGGPGPSARWRDRRIGETPAIVGATPARARPLAPDGGRRERGECRTRGRTRTRNTLLRADEVRSLR